jgi:hypothetical protein
MAIGHEPKRVELKVQGLPGKEGTWPIEVRPGGTLGQLVERIPPLRELGRGRLTANDERGQSIPLEADLYERIADGDRIVVTPVGQVGLGR